MAKGSHATWGAYDSRLCAICGKPIVISREDAWIHHKDGQHVSTHTACGSPLKVNR